MTINKEGKGILITLAILFIIADLIVYYFFRESPIVYKSVITGSIGIYLFFINFFRNPKRVFEGYEEGMILAPADGTVVVIEPTEETECLDNSFLSVR